MAHSSRYKVPLATCATVPAHESDRRGRSYQTRSDQGCISSGIDLASSTFLYGKSDIAFKLPTRARTVRSLRHMHLRRQSVAQAVDLVFQLAEKSQTALVRPGDFADDPAVHDGQIFLPPFGRAEIAAR